MVRLKTYVKEPREAIFLIRDDDRGVAVRNTSRTTIIFENEGAEVENTTEVPIAPFVMGPMPRKSENRI